jgi:hypothetical protein
MVAVSPKSCLVDNVTNKEMNRNRLEGDIDEEKEFLKSILQEVVEKILEVKMDGCRY